MPADIPMDEKALDTARLDALEAAMRKPGGLLLHNEASPTGRLGLGLMQRRSLREAIDTAFGPFAALPPVALPSREADLRRIIKLVAEHVWIIETAYNDATRDFGWQVNVRDGKATTTGQRYRPTRESFATEPVEAGLNGLRLLIPTEN